MFPESQNKGFLLFHSATLEKNTNEAMKQQKSVRKWKK